MARKRPIPKMFFPTLEFREHSRLRPERQHPEWNIAYAWAEAELFVISKLKEGEHPGVIEEIINTAIARSGGDDYRFKFLEFCLRIIRNLHANKLIDNLITIEEYDENIVDDYERRAKFEISMADICSRYKEELKRFVLDDESVAMLERTPELDKEAQETLKFLWEIRGAEADEHYGDNKMLLQPTPSRNQQNTLLNSIALDEANNTAGINRTRSL